MYKCVNMYKVSIYKYKYINIYRCEKQKSRYKNNGQT